MSMTIEQAKSELMQIYGMLSPDKQRAIDTLVKIEPCEKCVYSTKDGCCQYDDITETIPQFEPSGDTVSLETVIEWLKTKDIIKLSSQEETARKELKALPSVNPQEPKHCDRNICIQNEYNGIGCDECEVTKNQEPKTGHWIPVSERLPEDEQNVLFCDIDNDIMVGYHVKGRPDTHFSQDGTYDDMKNVRAWMPLPKPYRVEPQESEEV